MKMNDTVARIVEIMFQDAEQNEETAAIRDEVMNNCQERYNDLVNAGIAEDDAIAAVIESLKGMDEVLAPYKKQVQQSWSDVEEDLAANSKRHLIYPADEVHQINVVLVSEDVTVEASLDDCYHVLWDAEENPQVASSVHNGVLKVEHQDGDAVRMKADGQIDVLHKDAMSDFVKTENGKIEINMGSIDGMLRSIGQSLKNVFTTGNKLRISFGFGDGRVTIQVPKNAMPHTKILTTSGDVDVQNVALAALAVTSTSGDIDIDLDENQSLEPLDIRTTSGDVEVSSCVARLNISSTSGDVEVEGRIGELTISTISGDTDVRAEVMQMNFKAISGDVKLDFESNAISSVCGSTTSGDVRIELDEGFGTVAIEPSTRFGDIMNRYQANGVGPIVTGSVSTISGDITIR